jgi:hypothetical protein
MPDRRRVHRFEAVFRSFGGRMSAGGPHHHPEGLMKRILVMLAALSLVVVAAVGYADGMAKGKAGSWKGEVLDAGCYLGHGAMGEKHKDCALKCAANGMPLMLMVGGKAILLTPNHDNPDAYNSLKTMAGSVAEITGTMSTRGGVSGIDVTGAKLAAAK